MPTSREAAAKLRDQASLLAHEDPQAAERLARTIEDPWYRCQALAHVARHAADPGDTDRLARSALDAASSADDAYRQVAASAWPIRALLERDRRDLALQCLELCLTAAPRITPASSRADALLLLLHAAFDTSTEVRRGLVFAIAEIRDDDPHWRVTRALQDAIALLAGVDGGADLAFAERIARGTSGEEQDRRKLIRQLERPGEPRDFFF